MTYAPLQIRGNSLGANPDIFFLVDNPESSFFKSGHCIEHTHLLFLTHVIKERLGLNIKFQIWNNIPFNSPISNIKSLVFEAKKYKDQVLETIVNSNPKIIITCGKVSISLFDENYSGSFDKFKANYNGITVLGAPSLKYTVKNINKKREADNLEGLIKSLKLASYLLSGDDFSSISEDTNYSIIDAVNPDKVESLLTLFKDDKEIVLDYEASSLETYSSNFHLGGIGISSTDRQRSVYVYFYDFWRNVSEEKIPERSLEIIRELLTTKKTIIYNSYERAVSISPSVGLEVNLEAEDVLLNLRCLGRGKSLKQACQDELNVENWSDDVEVWVDCIKTLVNLQKATKSMKGQREEIVWLESNPEKSYFDIEEYFQEKVKEEVLKEAKRLGKNESKVLTEEILNSGKFNCLLSYVKDNQIRLNVKLEKNLLLEEISNLPLPSFKVLRVLFLNKRENEVIDYIKKLKTLLSGYYEGKANETGNRLKSYMLKLLYNYESFEYPSYADIPLSIVSRYCVLDCKYTAALHLWVKEELERKNLIKAAQYYNNHGYLGYVLSRNGIAWDDQLASKLEKEYHELAVENLRSLILLPSMERILGLSPQARITINSTYDLDVLSSVFNPNSSYRYTGDQYHKSTIVRMTKAICTPRVKLSAILLEILEYSSNFDNPDMAKGEYPFLYDLYSKLSKLETHKERLEFIETTIKKGGELSDKIRQRAISTGKAKEYELFSKYSAWKLESLDQSNVEFIFKIFNVIMKINPNDLNKTSVEEFKAFYHYRIFKKVLKSKDTYINGSCGRKSVGLIPKDSVFNLAPVRVDSYYPNNEDNRIYLVNTSWGVCTALTKRWQAAQHTVPSSTELMDLRTTRFEDGLKLHFDYGQAEVRVLAKLSNETNLLRAFKEGLDPHRVSASLMWKIPQEEVTSEQRRAAKAVTFSLLYGKSIAEFANDVTNGNIIEAQKIFDDFFTSYPNLEVFINKMHKQGVLNGWVPSLFGDPIAIQTPAWFFDHMEDQQLQLLHNPYDYEIEIKRGLDREEDRKERSKLGSAKRTSQNYCIQNSSSMVAGLAIYEIQKELERLELTAKLECFTHDSGDLDFQVKDIITILDFLPKMAVEYPKNIFDLPMEIDFEIGVSNNKMVELSEVVRDGNKLTANFSGKRESLDLLLERLENNGIKLEYTIDSEKEEVSSIDELFLTKRAFASSLGKPFTKVSGNLVLQF